MGDIFVLTPPIKKVITSAIDSLIHQLGKNCKCIYTPISKTCPNCVVLGTVDTIGRKSTNKYKTGGPMPFVDMQVCPMCNGSNQIVTENFDIVKVLVQWNPKEWFLRPQFADIQINIADDYCQIKGFWTDVPKILNADTIEVEYDLIGAYKHYKMRRDSEPIDMNNIVQGRYFSMLLHRVG